MQRQQPDLEPTAWNGTWPSDWAALIIRAEQVRADHGLGLSHAWQAIDRGDYQEAARRLNVALAALGEPPLESTRAPRQTIVQSRCGRPKSDGSACRTPTPGGVGTFCAAHRDAPAVAR